MRGNDTMGLKESHDMSALAIDKTVAQALSQRLER
jgi:hypothetical protein